MLRYEVPADNADHIISLPKYADVLHVASRDVDVVEFWTEVLADTLPRALPRRFRVFGTGDPIPMGYQYRGTCLAGESRRLVWHLYEGSTG